MSLSVFAAAAEAPDRPALVTDAGTVTWAGLARRVARVAAELRTAGLAGRDPVALTASNDVRTVEVLHALIALGTPALLLHPRLTVSERESLLEAARPAGRLAADGPPVRYRDPAGAASAGSDPAPDVVDPGPDELRPPPPADERPLAIIHTSGTSGTPKGVVLSRRAFAASAAASAANLGWRDHDRWLLPLPLAHVGGLSILTRCLLARRALVLAGGPEPRTLVEAVRRHRVTLLSLVPTQLRRILDLDPPAPPPAHLRAVLLGGAAAPAALLERAADAAWPVLTTYGQTEACSQVTTQRYGTVNRGEAGSGPPLPGVELRMGDEDAILVRGPTLFSGYIPGGDDPFLEGGWFATGDRGRLDADGNLHVFGRRTDRIVTGGENVDPVEVEQALERLPGVREACVFGVADPEWGEVVCAAVVPAGAPPPSGSDRTPAAETLVAQVLELRQRLAPFKLPRRMAILETLPHNAVGKVDRDEVRRIAVDRLTPLD